jgi:Predicted AAA-ATPase
MPIQKYPIGQQDFGEIRRGQNVYVDKTMYIHKMITSYKYYFLSRPRRFGKSLMVSTLDQLFKGSKDLFEGLYIHDKWLFEEYPIIKISFTNIGYRTSTLSNALNNILHEIASSYDLQFENKQDQIDVKFKELIIKLNSKYNKNVVVLIDEYDIPIIDYLDKANLHKAKENRDVMKSFYSILKDADSYLKLVFITGISKFSQVSIFTDLNNLYDLTMQPEYNEICGISQADLDGYFSEEMKTFDRDKIKEWYNGYRWDVNGVTLYNPFSILNFFSGGKFQNYWFSTGSPTFLMELSKTQKLYDVSGIELSSFNLSNFDIDKLEVHPILFQTGYITIIGYDPIRDRYTLDYPNREVRLSYLMYLTQAYTDAPSHRATNIPFEMEDALKSQNPAMLQKSINEAFSFIPPMTFGIKTTSTSTMLSSTYFSVSWEYISTVKYIPKMVGLMPS